MLGRIFTRKPVKTLFSSLHYYTLVTSYQAEPSWGQPWRHETAFVEAGGGVTARRTLLHHSSNANLEREGSIHDLKWKQDWGNQSKTGHQAMPSGNAVVSSVFVSETPGTHWQWELVWQQSLYFALRHTVLACTLRFKTSPILYSRKLMRQEKLQRQKPKGSVYCKNGQNDENKIVTWSRCR